AAEAEALVEGDRVRVRLLDFEVGAPHAALGERVDHRLEQALADLAPAALAADDEAVDAARQAAAVPADEGDPLADDLRRQLGHEEHGAVALLEVLELALVQRVGREARLFQL